MDFLALLYVGPESTIPVIGPIITIVVNVLLALFRLFRGGVSAAVRRALEGLREGVVNISNAFMRLGTMVARALRGTLATLATLYNQTILRMLRHLERLTARLQRLYERVLRPYLEALERYRKIILDIYDRFFRPVIEAIDAVRRAVGILAGFRIPFARRLDAYLGRLQARILEPIHALLERVNRQGWLLNSVLSSRWLVQRPIFLRSAWAYQGQLVNYWWTSQTRGLTAADLARIPPRRPAATVDDAIADFTAHVDGRGSRISHTVDDAIAEFDRLRSGG